MQKIKWDAIDYASSDAVTELTSSKGYSNRKLSEILNDKITYGRIHAIKTYRRSPIRMSEFVDICRACEVDPVEMFSKVIEESNRREDNVIR